MRTCLVVDDSSVIRRRIERCQGLEQLQVVGLASNGVEAIELFRLTDPDVVTMDITMPQMDGIECLERLVAMKPDVLILVISALADKATAVEAMAVPQMPTKWTDWIRANIPAGKIGKAEAEESELTARIAPSKPLLGLLTWPL